MDGKRAHILLAEDEQLVARPLVACLQAQGYKVAWVQAVHEVRAALTDDQPDLLLLDTTLDTDGLEFLQALRFAPEHPPAGVVVLTEPGDVPTKERAHQLGAAAVLPKPVREPDLVATVEELLTLL